MGITVYSTPACAQCRMSKHILKRSGIDYTPVDLSTDLDAHRFVTRGLGYKAAPVVYAVFPDGHVEHWTGLRPDLLQRYVDAATAEVAA